MYLRISANILILLSIFYFSWWVTVLFVLISFFVFKNFYEGILAGFLVDILYGTKTIEFMNIWFVFTAFSAIFYFIIEKMKKSIRWYETD